MHLYPVGFARLILPLPAQVVKHMLMAHCRAYNLIKGLPGAPFRSQGAALMLLFC